MQYSWLHNTKRDRLLVFLNGWGMDAQPFKSLGTRQYDVLNVYDFRNMDETDHLFALIAGYSEYILLAWSMGVWAGQRIFAGRDALFARTIAINGTLCPVDDRYGIPRDLFIGTMDGWSDLSRRKFYHRLCGSHEVEARFLENQPDRDFSDQQDELAFYLEFEDCMDRDVSIYREIVVSDRDRIVPTAHQLAYWGADRVVSLEGGHFPFYCRDCWDDLLEYVKNCAK